MCQHPTNAMLNMVELEAIACRAPIVAMDVFEIIKVPYDKIMDLSFKVLENKDFKKTYIDTNYNYVKNTHSVENVAKLYESILSKCIEDKNL